MIRSFRHKGLEDFHYDFTKKGIQPNHASRLALILDVLEAATTIRDLEFPGAGLHQLQPKQDNRWAIKVSGNWRITFRFDDGDIHDADYQDYH